MTTKATWLMLAKDCEQAKEANRGIEFAIHEATGRRIGDDTPKYTMSLDAITALIERKLPGFYWMAQTRATPLGDRTAEGMITNGKMFMTGLHRGADVFAFTPATALCAAFCRMMAEKAKE